MPYIVPDVLKYAVVPQDGAGAQEAAAFWSDAAVWAPWALWEPYGDPRVLEASFESMLAHGRRVQSLLSPSGVWDKGFQFGDWLDPDAPADRRVLPKLTRAWSPLRCFTAPPTVSAQPPRFLAAIRKPKSSP